MPPPPPQQGFQKRLRVETPEEQIGIQHRLVNLYQVQEEGANAFKPFTASLKTLYSDFVVREIPNYVANSNKQEPLKLNPMKVSPEAKDKAPATVGTATAPTAAGGEEAGGGIAKEVILGAFVPLLGEEKGAALVEFVEAAFSNPEQFQMPFECGTIDVKETRKNVHHNVKSVLGSKFVSSTSNDKPGCLVIEVATRKNTDRRDREDRNRHRGMFLHFTLYKENLDSNSALRQIATKIGVGSRHLMFSGTKDKRAVTLQRVACKELSAERLEKLNRGQWGRNCTVRLGDFSYHKEGLQLGGLQGNNFTITLRQSNDTAVNGTIPSVEEIAKVGDLLRAHGCVNYFGPQRFGTTSVLTCDIGSTLLKMDFKKTVHLIFKSQVDIAPIVERSFKLLTGEQQEVAAAPQQEEGGEENENGKRAREEQTEVVEAKPDVQGALAAIPHFCYMEKDILKHLVKCPNDYHGAVMTLPRTLTMLYCHSVQSLIWNIMATTRISKSFQSVIEGDLVLADAEAVVVASDDAEEPATKEEGETAEEEQKEEVRVHLPQVKALTAEDVASGKYNISDVILPVPGTDTDLCFPAAGSCCSREEYMKVIRAKGVEALIDPDHQLAKQLHFHGTYRKLILRPSDFEIERRELAGPRSPAIKTDLEELIGERKKFIKRDSNGEPIVEEEEKTEPSVAVVVKFSLPAGAYATSVLRELCKVVNE